APRVGSRRSPRGRTWPTRAAPDASRCRSPPKCPSVRAEVVDVEVVEPARRSIPPKLGRIGIVDPGRVQQRADLGHVLVAHLLLLAIGSETGDAATHVQP